MYAADVGADAKRRPVRSGPRRWYRGEFGGCRKSLYSKNGYEYRAVVVRIVAEAGRIHHAPPHRGGALLDGPCFGGRGERNASPLGMYVGDLGAAASVGPGPPNQYRVGRGGCRGSAYEQNGAE